MFGISGPCHHIDVAFASHTQSSVAVAYDVVLVAVDASMGFWLVPVLVRRLVAVASYSHPFASASSGLLHHISLLPSLVYIPILIAQSPGDYLRPTGRAGP